jgi:hypothetical protein
LILSEKNLEEKAMNKIRKNKAHNITRAVVVLVAMTICLSMEAGFETDARAHDGAAFLGGMVAAHVIGGAVRRSERRTEAAEYQAYSQPRSVQQAAPAPAPAAKQTAKQKLDELDKLAAGGYITPEEYKAKKKAILDSM